MNPFKIQDLTPNTFQKLKLTVLFIACLFSAVIYASEPTKTEVTIDSPPEVVAEDFVKVAVVPESWVFQIWTWLGTDNVDVLNLTEEKIVNYIDDSATRKNILEVANQFKASQKNRDIFVLRKRLKDIYIFPIKDKTIASQAIKVVESIRHILPINIVFLNSDHIDESDQFKEKSYLSLNIAGTGGNVDVLRPYENRDQHLKYSEDRTKYFKFPTGIVLWHENGSIHKILEYLKKDGVWDDWHNNFGFTDGYLYSTKENREAMFYVDGVAIIDKTNNEILSSVCIIYDQHPDEIKRSLTTECILRSLGLLATSKNKYANLGIRSNTLNNIKWMPDPTEYDLLLLKLLYDKSIKPGMNSVELKELVKNILINMEN